MDGEQSAELLVRCLRGGADEPPPLPRLSPRDWRSVAQQGQCHGVSGLLYAALRATGPRQDVPPRLLEELQQTYLHTTALNVRLYHCLSGLLRALHQAQVPAIVLKGAHLAEEVYGDIGLRPMVDIDLLVRRPDMNRLEQELPRGGYSLRKPHRKQWYEENHFHLAYAGRQDVLIDVHWNLDVAVSSFGTEIDALWQRARTARIADVATLVLSREDLLLHLCLHLSCQHRFDTGLRPLCDIAQTIRHFDGAIDWEAVIGIARRHGIMRPVAASLLLSQAMLGAPIPPAVLQDLQADSYDAPSMKLIRRYILDVSVLAAMDMDVSEGLQQSVATNGFMRLVRTAARRVWPALTELRKIYGLPPDSRRAALYYLVRPADLLRRRGLDVLKLALGTRTARSAVQREKSRVAIDHLLGPHGEATRP